MTPRLIAIDMDGTLLGSDGDVSPRNLEALKMAHEQGVEVVIATGRRHSYAMRVLRELELCEANALISSNGTVIRSVGAGLMHREHLPLATALWLTRHVADFRSSLVFTFDTVQPNGEDTPGALVCEHGHDLDNNIGRWMEANRPYFRHVDRLEDALLAMGEEAAPIQAMLCGPIERMREAEARLLESPRVTRWEPGAEPTEAEITLHRTEYPARDLMMVDILPAGCSKASALEHLTAVRGMSRSEVMAIGDNWNDLPMLEFAGKAVVMANAPGPLRTLAASRGWEIAPTNDADGVAWAMESALEPAGIKT